MGYLGVFKHGNGTYSYQMYNRDSLYAVMPSKGKACKEIASLLAVIGHFERKINSKKTIPLPIGKDVKIAGSKLGFKEHVSNNGFGITLNSEGCFVIFEVYVEYEVTYNTSYTEEVIETVRFYDQYVVEIPCTPADYPGKTLGFSWLWWEFVIITPEERAIFDKIYEDDPFQEPEPGEPCKGTNRLGSVMRAGNVEHWMIQFYYLQNNPMAKREYQIPKAGANGGLGYADLVNLATMEIFEIKKNDISEFQNARNQLSRYCTKAIDECNLYLHKGTNFGTVILPYPGKQNFNLEARLYESGLIVYQEKPKNQPPVPIIIPSSVMEKLRNLINDMKKYPATAEIALKVFFEIVMNTDAKDFIRTTVASAGVAILVATLLEDIATVGAGTWDDPVTVSAAWRLINFAMAL